MKHKKLSISIVSAFIAALGLTSCSNNVTASDDSIVTLKGYDGQEIAIDTDAIYDKYKYSEDGINSFYQAILEVVIRNFYETSTNPEVSSRLAEMEAQARNDVLSDQETARENATTNGTDYDTEWQSILDSAGVDDEEGLYQSHLYDLERADYEDRYFEDHKSELTNEYIGFASTDGEYSDYDGVHASKYPYHVRHILVNTTASATDYVTGEITAAEAQNLNTVYKALSNGRYTFGQVAHEWSEDSSATNYGDSGIMDTSTEFVNEFKLGLYAFDAVYGTDVTGNATLKENKLGLDGSYNEGSETVKDKLESIGLQTVSYEVFEFLGDHYDDEKSDAGLSVNEGAARYFPRNVFWNNYLNLHNVFVITDQQLEILTQEGDNWVEDTTYTHYVAPTEAVSGRAGFRHVAALDSVVGSGTRVLTDENGRVIVGVRSEYGIHFMIMQRTPFEVSGTISGYNSETGTYSYNDTAINEYYTTYVPNDQEYPKRADGTNKTTYINFMISEDSTYESRAQEVEDLIQSFDNMYDYRIFETLIANGQITINDEVVAERIDDFINQRREYNEWNDAKTLNDSWNSYLDKISLQYEIRDDENGLENSSRLTKVTCGIHFGDYNPDDPLWSQGGACYYEN